MQPASQPARKKRRQRKKPKPHKSIENRNKTGQQKMAKHVLWIGRKGGRAGQSRLARKNLATWRAWLPSEWRWRRTCRFFSAAPDFLRFFIATRGGGGGGGGRWELQTGFPGSSWTGILAWPKRPKPPRYPAQITRSRSRSFIYSPSSSVVACPPRPPGLDILQGYYDGSVAFPPQPSWALATYMHQLEAARRSLLSKLPQKSQYLNFQTFEGRLSESEFVGGFQSSLLETGPMTR